ncbi:MAG: DUF1801 domain-containing protein [Candidatus Acidiferrales bacterium]
MLASMAKSATNAQVTAFLKKARQWRAELAKLRELLLDTGLTEELKWGQAAFTIDGANVAIIGVMKETCSLAFFKGVLLKDPKRILSAPGQNSRSTRGIKFRSVGEIVKQAATLKSYVREAIEPEKSGAKVDLKRSDTLKPPAELQEKFASSPAFNKAFHALTYGRQRAYILHFAGAKQSATRQSRIAVHADRILSGKGLND